MGQVPELAPEIAAINSALRDDFSDRRFHRPKAGSGRQKRSGTSSHDSAREPRVRCAMPTALRQHVDDFFRLSQEGIPMKTIDITDQAMPTTCECCGRRHCDTT